MAWNDDLIITPASHTPYADLDLLLNESDRAWTDLAPMPSTTPSVPTPWTR